MDPAQDYVIVHNRQREEREQKKHEEALLREKKFKKKLDRENNKKMMVTKKKQHDQFKKLEEKIHHREVETEMKLEKTLIELQMEHGAVFLFDKIPGKTISIFSFFWLFHQSLFLLPF